MPGTLGFGPEDERLGEANTSAHVQVFKASCEVWVIYNGAAPSCFEEKHVDSSPQHEHAEKVFQQLLAWADTLPLALIPTDRSVHSVVMMQCVLPCP